MVAAPTQERPFRVALQMLLQGPAVAADRILKVPARQDIVLRQLIFADNPAGLPNADLWSGLQR